MNKTKIIETVEWWRWKHAVNRKTRHTHIIKRAPGNRIQTSFIRTKFTFRARLPGQNQITKYEQQQSHPRPPPQRELDVMDVESQDPHGSDDGPLDRLNPFRKTDERKKHWGYSACDFTDYISSRLSFFSFADRVYTRLLRSRLLLRGTRWMKGVRARSIETKTMKRLGIIDIYQRTDVSVIGTERERNATRDAYRTESFVDNCNLVAGYAENPYECYRDWTIPWFTFNYVKQKMKPAKCQ